MVAHGGDDGPEVQRAHRIVGAWELAKMIRRSAALGRYVIAVRTPSLGILFVFKLREGKSSLTPGRNA